ncbi:hypothetical protein [Saccharothrix saharensis]|uniref:hypothetical protein n=1 Tax=Saccharothrix saharensis TaxID=571190 RepID=UPI0011512DE1|nr:hypothetical protein [Saccharothrix saharensis]
MGETVIEQRPERVVAHGGITSLNPETIAELQPDLIIGSQLRAEQQHPKLSAIRDGQAPDRHHAPLHAGQDQALRQEELHRHDPHRRRHPRPPAGRADDLAVEVGTEQITRADGDWIPIGTYGDQTKAAQRQVLAGPLWQP